MPGADTTFTESPITIVDVGVIVVKGADPGGTTSATVVVVSATTLDRIVKMADMTDSPPLFDTNETKLDDLEDDDEDIFASAVQVLSETRELEKSGRPLQPRQVPRPRCRGHATERSVCLLLSNVRRAINPKICLLRNHR